MRTVIIGLLLVGCTAGDPLGIQDEAPRDTLVGVWIDEPAPRQLACDLPVSLDALPDSIGIYTKTPWVLNDGTTVIRGLRFRMNAEGVQQTYATGTYRHYDARAFDVYVTAWMDSRVSFARGWHCAEP
jgi:hypothetical protein